MLSLGSVKLRGNSERISLVLNRASPVILAVVMTFAILENLLMIQLSDGGGDLVGADIPKSLMLLHGQNPYSVNPWASPYPPLLLVTVAGIIQVTGFIASQFSPELVSQHIRIAGLFANSAVALIIYLFIRSRTGALRALITSGLFLTLPALGTSAFWFFHSDTFGYPILALSIVALAQHRYFIGTSLLATATIFKIHPVLALPLVMVWLLRTLGLRRSIPSLVSAITIVIVGLFLPLGIPGYQQAILGFNLSVGDNGAMMFTILSPLNQILPQAFHIAQSQQLTNQIWIISTTALYTVLLGIVWTRARSLSPIDIILLGLLAWFIPMRIIFTHYAAWTVIPFFMRGQLKQTILIAGLLQLAETMDQWSWAPNTSPIQGMSGFYSIILASATYRLLGLAALAMILTRTRTPTIQPLRVLASPIISPVHA